MPYYQPMTHMPFRPRNQALATCCSADSIGGQHVAAFVSCWKGETFCSLTHNMAAQWVPDSDSPLLLDLNGLLVNTAGFRKAAGRQSLCRAFELSSECIRSRRREPAGLGNMPDTNPSTHIPRTYPRRRALVCTSFGGTSP
jgi:hypothetical protein